MVKYIHELKGWPRFLEFQRWPNCSPLCATSRAG